MSKHKTHAVHSQHRSHSEDEPYLLISTTSSYDPTPLWNTENDRGGADCSMWRPTPEDGSFFTVGDLVQPGYGGPTSAAIIVKAINDNGTNPLLRAPVNYERVWHDHGSGAKLFGSIWRPKPPDGYVALGYVCNTGYYPPNDGSGPNLNYACIRLDLADPLLATDVQSVIWSADGTHAQERVICWALPGLSSAFVAQQNYDAWSGAAFKIRGYPPR